MDTGILPLVMGADQYPAWEVTTVKGGSTPQDMTGWTMQLVIRRVIDDEVVFSTTSVSIGAGVGAASRATVTIPATGITGWEPGTGYYGALWRTNAGSNKPVWGGPVVLGRVAAQV